MGTPASIAEHEATGEVAEIYHDLQQTLRVNGVNLVFRTWAGFGRTLRPLWDALRPNAGTRALEAAADRIRAEAVDAAEAMGLLGARGLVRLGESQAYHIRKALALYHYINPKLLVLTSAVTLALDGQAIGRGDAPEDPGVPRGVPPTMSPMEMVDSEPDDERLQELFEDISTTLELSQINSDYRTLALWPDYLGAAWAQLKPKTKRDDYRRASEDLRKRARDSAGALPYPVPITEARIDEAGDDAASFKQLTLSFERLLPSLIVNVALMQLDWLSPEEARRSPFPVS
ncbi:halocarboxylic acid dehydrogenase DehI family protein [Candidatus Nitrospira bockiana]